MNLQTGAFGDPAQTQTLILFWSKMEQLHYPGAASTKKFLEDRLEQEQQVVMAGTELQTDTVPGIPGNANQGSMQAQVSSAIGG